MTHRMPHGAGLGFRRELLAELKAAVPANIDFFELAPENWAGMGGRSARDLRHFTERHPSSATACRCRWAARRRSIRRCCSGSGPSWPSTASACSTEHLSWCADDHHLYELLPIPLTGDAVRWTAARIRQVQDILGCRIGIENASTYLSHRGRR
jgi:uncharacterized protein (UPF0276 family)